MAEKKTEAKKQTEAKQPEAKETPKKTAKKPAAKKAPAKDKKPKKEVPATAAAQGSKLNEQVKQILKEAEEKGIKTNFFFASTLHRYVVQLNIMTNLEQKIKQSGELVTKEYVKGRENLYVNPAVSEYNKTSTAANGTVATLMKILTTLNSENPEGASKLSKMLEALNNDE